MRKQLPQHHECAKNVAVIADFPLQIWLLIVSILMIRKREANAETLRVRELKEVL